MSTKVKKHRDSKKFNDWCDYFLNQQNSTTYGNATQSALKAYNTKDYSTAGVIGYENLKKLKILSSIVAEKEGYGYARMIRIGLKKMHKSNDIRWWREMMVILGYYEKETPAPLIALPFNFAEAIAKSSAERNLKP